MKKTIATLLFSLAAMPLLARDVTVVVKNDLNVQRQQLIEIDLSQVRSQLGIGSDDPFVVKNMSRQQVAYQITHDGKLLIDVAVKPNGTTRFTITKGIPEPMKTYVQGKMYPMRKDDIAWENDRGAYRLYGPALQRSGEKSFGIDVWTKNTPDLDVSERYYKDYEGNVTGWANAKNGHKDDYIDLHTSFHLDHGTGLDCYEVGPTLGCGTPALMDGKELVLPYCYKKYKILDNGPLRFTVELTYNTVKFHGADVTEHRIVSLDKGSNFNRMTVWYDSLPAPTDLAAGVVLHKADPDNVVIGKNYVEYADPTDQPEKYGFQLYVAALFPEEAKTCKLMMAEPKGNAVGHAIGIKKGLKADERYTYYFGSAWSCYDVRTQQEWQLHCTEFLDALSHPLTVTLQ
jgi:hypothetical protein